ncbi:hypothetical protein ACFFWB_25795 [Flavobacterium procerum]|uniref:hypothetical protein n=1 Tax=Flavobacterium procerum TaxID=1455569 RepID=UPI0035E9080C
MPESRFRKTLEIQDIQNHLKTAKKINLSNYSATKDRKKNNKAKTPFFDINIPLRQFYEFTDKPKH